MDRHKEALSWDFLVPKRFGQNSDKAGTNCLFTFTSRTNLIVKNFLFFSGTQGKDLKKACNPNPLMPSVTNDTVNGFQCTEY